MSCIVGRLADPSSADSVEYLVDDNNASIIFESKAAAIEHLKKNEVTSNEIDDLMFIEVDVKSLTPLIEKITAKECSKLLSTCNADGECSPLGRFYTEHDGEFIAIDNRSGLAWVNTFKTKEDCLLWLRETPVVDNLGMRQN